MTIPTARHKQALIATGILAVMLAVSMYTHELWRDEVQAWMISAASGSIMDILWNVRYEGHPPLWHFMIWPFTLSSDPDMIKVPHYLLTLATAFLILRYSPFPFPVAVMLVMGYYFYYEYGVISRNYQLGLFGMVGLLSCWDRALARPLIAVFFLSITAMANVYSLVMSLTLAFFFAIRSIVHHKAGGSRDHGLLPMVIGGLLYVFIVAVTIYWLKPPEDGSFSPQWYLSYDPQRMIYMFSWVWRSLLPIPMDAYSFWNSSIFPDEQWVGYAGMILSVVLILLFIRHPRYLFILTGMLLALLAFQYVKYIGYLRHGGHIWLAFVISVWIVCARVGWKHVFRSLRVVFVALLLVHLYASVMAIAKDLATPFSSGKETAGFVKDAGYEDPYIIAHMDYAVSTFTAYHGAPVFYPMSRSIGTFMVWSEERRHGDLYEFLFSNEEDIRQREGPILVISNDMLHEGTPWLRPVFTSSRSIVSDERLHVYEVLPLKGYHPSKGSMAPALP